MSPQQGNIHLIISELLASAVVLKNTGYAGTQQPLLSPYAANSGDCERASQGGGPRRGACGRKTRQSRFLVPLASFQNLPPPPRSSPLALRTIIYPSLCNLERQSRSQFPFIPFIRPTNIYQRLFATVMDLQTLSNLFATTLNPNPNVHKAAELEIRRVFTLILCSALRLPKYCPSDQWTRGHACSPPPDHRFR